MKTIDAAISHNDEVEILEDGENPSVIAIWDIRARVFLSLTPWNQLDYDNLRTRKEKEKFILDMAINIYQ